jgi:hypothetical protein
MDLISTFPNFRPDHPTTPFSALTSRSVCVYDERATSATPPFLLPRSAPTASMLVAPSAPVTLPNEAKPRSLPAVSDVPPSSKPTRRTPLSFPTTLTPLTRRRSSLLDLARQVVRTWFTRSLVNVCEGPVTNARLCLSLVIRLVRNAATSAAPTVLEIRTFT